MKQLPFVAFGLLTITAPYSLWAQDTNKPQPEEITVTATPLGSILQPTQILTSEELMLRNTPTIGETLANELGVNSTYFGPGASRPVIRGLGGSRVTMLSDRTSTMDASAVSPDHAVAVEMLLADEVEIIRGPTTILYGSSAAGGIINVIDSRIPKTIAEEPIAGAVEVRGDTAAEERAIVGRLDGGLGNLAWHVEGYDRDTDNIDIAGFATADPAERPADEKRGTLPNSYSNSDGYSGGLSWVGDKGYLGAAVSGFQTEYGLPGPVEEEGGDGEPEPFEGPFLDMDQTRIDLRGEYLLENSLIEKAKIAVATNDYTHREIEGSGEVATTFENDQWEARFEAVHNLVADFKGAAGIEFDSRDFSAVGEEAFIGPSETRGWGFFVAEERAFEWGDLSLGGRIEPVEHTNANFSDYDKTALAMAGGVGLDVPGDNKFIVNLSYTQRNPDIEELYSDGAHIATRQFEVGLLALPGGTATTEDSINLELGLRHDEGAVNWDASVFYYDFSDYIYQDLTGAVVDDLPEAFYTQADADFYGAEGAVNFAVWEPGRFTNNLRLFGDVVNAELDNGDKLPRIPPWRLGASFMFGPEPWEAAIDVIYNAEQDDISSFNTDAYTMVNLSFVYRLNVAANEWQFFLRGTNLADEDARKSTSFLAAYASLPGRSLSAGFRAAF